MRIKQLSAFILIIVMLFPCNCVWAQESTTPRQDSVVQVGKMFQIPDYIVSLSDMTEGEFITWQSENPDKDCGMFSSENGHLYWRFSPKQQQTAQDVAKNRIELLTQCLDKQQFKITDDYQQIEIHLKDGQPQRVEEIIDIKAIVEQLLLMQYFMHPETQPGVLVVVYGSDGMLVSKDIYQEGQEDIKKVIIPNTLTENIMQYHLIEGMKSDVIAHLQNIIGDSPLKYGSISLDENDMIILLVTEKQKENWIRSIDKIIQQTQNEVQACNLELEIDWDKHNVLLKVKNTNIAKETLCDCYQTMNTLACIIALKDLLTDDTVPIEFNILIVDRKTGGIVNHCSWPNLFRENP